MPSREPLKDYLGEGKKMPDPEKPYMSDYLGDGLYARFDGYQIRLWCQRGPGIVHEVYLEGNVFHALLRFVERIKDQYGDLP